MKFFHPVSHGTFLQPDSETEDQGKKLQPAKLRYMKQKNFSFN